MNHINRFILACVAVACGAAMVALAPPESPESSAPPAQAAPKADAPVQPAASAAAAQAVVPLEPEFSELLDGMDCEHDVEVQPDGTTMTKVAHPIKPTLTQEIPIETVRVAIQVAREIDPALANRLAALCDKDSAECEQTLRLSGQRLLALAELKQRDPQLYGYKLGEVRHELQIRKLAGDFRRAMATGDTTQAEVIVNQLRTVLQVQLAWSLKARGEYLCRLEEQVQKVKDELARDAAKFQQTVDERLQELTQAASSNTAGAVTPVASKPVRETHSQPRETPPPQPIPATPR
jgi:hypothetical protein